MSTSMIGAAGGLSAVDKAKLIPENIREGVTLFEGTPREIEGNLLPAENLVVLMAPCSRSPGIAQGYRIYQNGNYIFKFYGDAPSGTVPGTVKKVVISGITQNANICGHTQNGVFDTGHTNNFTIDPNYYDALFFVVLGTVD